MHNIQIRELPGIVEYLQKIGLLEAYRIRKYALQDGIIGGSYFKKRKPLQDISKQVFYFRINRKYRAFLRYKEGMYVVYEISDHQ